VVESGSLVPDLAVGLGHHHGRFPAPAAALLTPRQAPLRPPQPAQTLGERTRMVDFGSIRERYEAVQAHIDADLGNQMLASFRPPVPQCSKEKRRIPLSPEGDSPLRAELMALTIPADGNSYVTG